MIVDTHPTGTSNIPCAGCPEDSICRQRYPGGWSCEDWEEKQKPKRENLLKVIEGIEELQ